MLFYNWTESKHKRHPKGTAWSPTGPGPGRFAPGHGGGAAAVGAGGEEQAARNAQLARPRRNYFRQAGPPATRPASAATVLQERPDGFRVSQEARQARARLLATFGIYEIHKRKAGEALVALDRKHRDLMLQQYRAIGRQASEIELLGLQEQSAQNRATQNEWWQRFHRYEFAQLKRMRQVLAVRQGINLDAITDIPRTDVKRRQDMAMALGEVHRLIAGRTVDGYRPRIRFRLVDDLEDQRAEFEMARIEQGEWVGDVKMDKTTGRRQLVHELGHYLEESDPDNFQAARDFIAHRTAGKPLRKMKEIDPTRARWYRDDVYGQHGGFLDKYMGRFYSAEPHDGSTSPDKRSATELISMGLEYYFYEPVRLAREDPELFEFMYDFAHGHFDSEHQ